MHYTDLTTDHSNEIHYPSFWCYFDPHENTTRMSNEMNNDPQMRNNAKRPTSVTIAPAKASLNNINRTITRRYREWESLQKNTETLSEDIGGDTRRRRESIQVPRTRRRSSSRSRTLGEGTEGRETTKIT